MQHNKLELLIRQNGVLAVLEDVFKSIQRSNFSGVEVTETSKISGGRYSIERSKGGELKNWNGNLDESHLFDSGDLYPYTLHMKLIYLHQYLIGHSVILRLEGVISQKELSIAEHVAYGAILSKVLFENGMYRTEKLSKKTREYASFYLHSLKEFFDNLSYDVTPVRVKRGNTMGSYDRHLPVVLSLNDKDKIRKALDILNSTLDKIIDRDFTFTSEEYLSSHRTMFVKLFEGLNISMKYRGESKLKSDVEKFQAKPLEPMFTPALLSLISKETSWKMEDIIDNFGVGPNDSILPDKLGFPSGTENKILEAVWIESRDKSSPQLKPETEAALRGSIRKPSKEEDAFIEADNEYKGTFKEVFGSSVPKTFAELDFDKKLVKYVYIPKGHSMIKLIDKDSTKEVTEEIKTTKATLKKNNYQVWKDVNKHGSVRLTDGSYIVLSSGRDLFSSQSLSDKNLIQRYVGDIIEKPGILEEFIVTKEEKEEKLEVTEGALPGMSSVDLTEIPDDISVFDDAVLKKELEMLDNLSIDAIDIPPSSDLVDPLVVKLLANDTDLKIDQRVVDEFSKFYRKSVSGEATDEDIGKIGLAIRDSKIRKIEEKSREIEEAFKENSRKSKAQIESSKSSSVQKKRELESLKEQLVRKSRKSDDPEGKSEDQIIRDSGNEDDIKKFKELEQNIKKEDGEIKKLEEEGKKEEEALKKRLEELKKSEEKRKLSASSETKVVGVVAREVDKDDRKDRYSRESSRIGELAEGEQKEKEKRSLAEEIVKNNDQDNIDKDTKGFLQGELELELRDILGEFRERKIISNRLSDEMMTRDATLYNNSKTDKADIEDIKTFLRGTRKFFLSSGALDQGIINEEKYKENVKEYKEEGTLVDFEIMGGEVLANDYSSFQSIFPSFYQSIQWERNSLKIKQDKDIKLSDLDTLVSCNRGIMTELLDRCENLKNIKEGKTNLKKEQILTRMICSVYTCNPWEILQEIKKDVLS